MKMTKVGYDGRPLGQPTLAGLLDEKTGLIWAPLDCSGGRMTHEQATKAAAAMDLCGQPGRLPTLDELETLRDVTRFNPAADPELGLKSEAYWTSTPGASSPGDYAWIVGFYGGGAVCLHQRYTALARAVRSSRASQ
jgi:hypothetical protein